jgi:hypothetical protein
MWAFPLFLGDSANSYILQLRIASEFVLGRVILAHITLLQQQNLVIKGIAYTQASSF